MQSLRNVYQLIFVSIVLSVIYFLLNAHPFNNDSLLAWPISESILNPSIYSGFDLVIEAGKKTNFLMYRLLTLFPWAQDNLPLRDTVIYFPIFCLFSFVWGYFFFQVSKDIKIAVLALAVFLFSDNKLGLHWSYSPLPFLISYTSVHFLQVTAFLLLFKKRYKSSFGGLGLTSFFHPATSLSYFLTFSLIHLLRERKIKQTIIDTAIFVPLFLINYFFLIGKSASGTFQAEHWKIYELFQFHTYIGDHFHEGYLYFFAVLGLIYSLKRYYPEDFFNFSKLFLGVSLAYCCLWLINIYFVKNMQFMYFYFPMRIFYLIKPLAIFSTVWGLSQFLQEFEPQVKTNLNKVLLFVCIFFFSKSFFRYSSFDSTLLVISIISIIRLNTFIPSLVLSGLFVLSAVFDVDSILRTSSLNYLTMPLLLLVIYFLCQERKIQNEN
jgi:hypothetical protein